MKDNVIKHAGRLVLVLALLGNAFLILQPALSGFSAEITAGSIVLPASFIGLIVLCRQILSNVGVRAWAVQLGVAHLVLVLLNAVFIVPRVAGSNADFMWVPMILIDCPASAGLLCIPNSTMAWSLWLGVFGTIEYSFIGWHLQRWAETKRTANHESDRTDDPPRGSSAGQP